MRVSTYTISIPLRDQPFHLLLNGLTGALDKVDQRVGRLVADNRKREDLTDFPVTGQMLAKLEQRGHLTRLPIEAERQLLIRAATELHDAGVQRALPSFLFIPTYVCQLRCSYCFQPHGIHRGDGEFGSILSDRQITDAFAIIDAMAEIGSFARLIETGQVVPKRAGAHEARSAAFNDGRRIGLFGGEPLTEHTHRAVATIAAYAQERGQGLSAITNGVELDRFADLLGPEPGQLGDLQVTFDGDQSVHDRRRIGPAHRATFSVISCNVDLALSKGVAVHARMNADRRNLPSLQKLAEYFEQRGWTKYPLFDFHVAAVDGFRSKNDILLTRADVANETTALYEKGMAHVISYEATARQLLQRCMTTDAYPFTGTANCSAETGQLMFDPLGDVHSCWDEVGDRSRRIGVYDGGGLRIDGPVAEQWLARFPGAIEECSRCPFALIHKSGCGSQARLASGTVLAPDCKTFQQLFPPSFASAYEEVEAAVLRAGVKGPPLSAASPV